MAADDGQLHAADLRDSRRLPGRGNLVRRLVPARRCGADTYAGDAVQIRTPTTPHTGDALVTALAGCRDTGGDAHAHAEHRRAVGHAAPPAPADPQRHAQCRDRSARRTPGAARTGRDPPARLADRPGSRHAGQCVASEPGCRPCRGRRRAPGGIRQALFASRTYWRRGIGAKSPSATIAMPSARRSNASPPDCRTRRGACWTDADQATAAAR